MARCFGRLVRTIERRIVTIMTIICAARLYEVRGFLSLSSIRTQTRVDCAGRWCRTLLRNSNICGEGNSVPTVVNPISKRLIHLGGPRYKKLIEEGGWVQHQGTLQRIDMKMLARYQQDLSFRDGPSISPFEEQSNTKDKWYYITPVALGRKEAPLNTEKNTASALTPIAMDERTIENLQRDLRFVNKPSHLHCVPSRSLSDSLATQLLSSHPNSKPCHRLDRDTSGIVLFGLTRESHRDISMQFEARTTSKMYVALVSGRPEEDNGIVNLPIGKQKTKEGFNRWTIGGEKPRESITHWNIDKVFTDAETGAIVTRVNLKPVTGRGHQLRLHMKAIGCPILGDTIHGEGGVAMCSPRLCLHARKLQVDWSGIRLEAESVPPF